MWLSKQHLIHGVLTGGVVGSMIVAMQKVLHGNLLSRRLVLVHFRSPCSSSDKEPVRQVRSAWQVLYWYDHYLTWWRNFHCPDGVHLAGRGIEGVQVTIRFSMDFRSAGTLLVCIDALSCILCIHNDSWIRITTVNVVSNTWQTDIEKSSYTAGCYIIAVLDHTWQ